MSETRKLTYLIQTNLNLPAYIITQDMNPTSHYYHTLDKDLTKLLGTISGSHLKYSGTLLSFLIKPVSFDVFYFYYPEYQKNILLIYRKISEYLELPLEQQVFIQMNFVLLQLLYTWKHLQEKFDLVMCCAGQWLPGTYGNNT
ncbi:hypothetical protein OTU49_009195 [Cherax quadricarinatus]|uniref:Uncharacterized protein n=1 Tax=Cherax quadricarinatus TaxID=27406 RepID=A0AAW0WMA2_CHEQU